MNQNKIGKFLKELRNEKGLTQEKFAEILGVSNRSVSRWENGINMPDLDLLIQIAKYFDVEIEELLNGERKIDMDKKTEETLLKVADYSNNEKMVLSKHLGYFFIVGVIAFIIYAVIDIAGLSTTGFYENIATIMLGIVFGVLLAGALYTRKCIMKIMAVKKRLLKKIKNKDC